MAHKGQVRKRFGSLKEKVKGYLWRCGYAWRKIRKIKKETYKVWKKSLQRYNNWSPKYKITKNKGVDKDIFIQQLQKRFLSLTYQH